MPPRPVRLALAFGLLFGSACQSSTPADLVIFGAVWTADSLVPRANAIAIRGDSIAAVGDSATIAALIGPETERIDNPGGLVMPGFIDDHVHLALGGQQLSNVDLRDAATPEEFVRRIAEFARTRPAGSWIMRGTWDHELWPGAPLPDRSWIDSVTPDHPVFVTRLDGHMSLANSAALRAAGIDRSIRDIPGGEIVRRQDGELTGMFKDAAMEAVRAVIPPTSQTQLDSIVGRALRHAASVGVTSMASVSSSWEDVAALRRARAGGTLTVRVSSYLPLEQWRSVADTVARSGPGDDWLRVAGVKGFVDGSLGSTTAYFDAPFSDAPSTSGFLVHPADSLRRWITAADSSGLQVVVHAIGDRANGLLLDLFDEAARTNGARDRRFRIEHAQHIRPADLPRFAALGVIPSMQPYHAADDGRWAEKRIGSERIKTTYAFRSLLDAKARLVFGSDWTVAPLEPMLGVKAAVTRLTIDGRGVFVPEERITVEEALRAYTVDNAYAMYLDGVVGRLAVGMKADIVVLDRDPLTVPAEELDRVRPRMTVVAGRVVHRLP
ncbi:MAG: amidohydrolase [Gemmatimonadales bacterium]